MSNLVNEILLRLAKAGLAFLLAVVVYVVLIGPFGATASIELDPPVLAQRRGIRPACRDRALLTSTGR